MNLNIFRAYDIRGIYGKDLGIGARAEDFKNQCGTAMTDGYLFGGNAPRAYYGYESFPDSPTLIAPSDVAEADGPFTVSICPGFWQRWFPTGFDFTCPTGHHQIRVILPAGYHLDVTPLTPAANGGSMSIPLKGRCSGTTSTISATFTEFPPVGPTPDWT